MARLIKALPALLALAAGAGTAIAVAAGGSTQLGQTTTAPVYGAEAPVVQLSTTPGSKPYATPRGVLTSWRYHSSADTPAGSVRLELFKPVAEGRYRAVAASDAQALNAGFRVRASAPRIPVRRGWLLGLDPGDDAEVGITVPIGHRRSDDPVHRRRPGGQHRHRDGAVPDLRVNVAATIEPDADRDRYGDRSQDRCPTQAATHRRCSNRFSLGRLRRDRGNGTASIAVKLPGPGRASVRGKGVVHRCPGSSTGSRAGVTARAPDQGKGKHAAALDRRGRARVRVRITYAPTGGSPRTKPKSVCRWSRDEAGPREPFGGSLSISGAARSTN